MARMKRLLALACFLPPYILPQSIQISRILKALRNFGWEVDALTADPSLGLLEVHDARLAAFYEGGYRRIPVGRITRPQRLWGMLRGTDWLDEIWAGAAVATGLELLEQQNYDSLATFAQPWSSHVVGLAIKERHPNLPWLAHFSDPWVDSPYYDKFDAESRARWTAQERAVIERADSVVFINQRTADRVMAKYPSEHLAKVHIAPHSYDPDLMLSQAVSHQPAKRPRFIYAGSFYGIRSPRPLFEAFQQLRKNMPAHHLPEILCLGASKIRHRFIAWKLGLGKHVRFKPGVGYLDCLSALQHADALLLVDAPAKENLFMPSKIVDYFMLQRPIIGITPLSGASADILSSLGCPCVDPEDTAGLVAIFSDAVAQWQETGQIARFMPDAQGVLEFHIDHVMQRINAALG